MDFAEYDVNECGETYGSGLDSAEIGEDPDLIMAIGTLGEKGYVRSEDLYPSYNTPAEALNAISNQSEQIPLYDLSGNVIGEFKLEVVDE